MSQQRSKAAAQLWDALKESKCLADSLKVPWRAEEACQQLAELLESVTSLLSHVFGRYRDSLFMGALNIHLQSSAQLLQFGLLKASRVADSCCGSPGPYAHSNNSKSAFVLPEAIQSTATSAAADIQLAVTVLATAVQYLEATQTLKQAEAAAVHYIANMKTGQRLQNCPEYPSSRKAEPFTGIAEDLEAAVELPIPAASVSNAAAPAIDGGSLQTEYVPRSSIRGQQRQLQNVDAVAVQAAAPGNSSTSNDLALPEAAVGAVTATEAVQAAEASLQDLHQQQQLLLQQQFEVPASQQQHMSVVQDEIATVLDTTSPPAAEHGNSTTAGMAARPRSPFGCPGTEVTQSAYNAARLQALKELLKPGSTWSAAEDGGNFQYLSPTSYITTPWSARQQQQTELEQASQHQEGLQQTASTPQQQQQQQHKPHAEATSAAAESHASGSLRAAQQQRQQQEEEGARVQDNHSPEMGQTNTWLTQQLQQVYNNPLLQGPKQQQQRYALLRRSIETSSGTAPPSNLPIFAVDPTTSPAFLAAKQQQQYHHQQQLGQAATGLGFATESPSNSLATAAGVKVQEMPELLSTISDLQQPAAVSVAASRLSGTPACNGDDLDYGVARGEGLGLRNNSEPGTVRRSTADLVSDLLGRNRTSSSSPGCKATSSSSSSSVRSSLQGSLHGPGGATFAAAAAAARHGGSSSAGWARNSVSGSSGPSPGVLVTSATGASLVQMLAAAAAGAVGSSEGGSLVAAVRQQLGTTAPSGCGSVTESSCTDDPAAPSAAGSVVGIMDNVYESAVLDQQLQNSRYHRHTTDLVPGGISSRTSSSSGLRHLRHTVDGVLEHRIASPPIGKGYGSPHQRALGPRNSKALRGSSSSDRGSPRSYVERYKMSISRPTSVDGVARHAAAAANRRQHSPAAAVRPGNTTEGLSASGSTGLEALVLLQQQRWQRQQQQQNQPQQQEIVYAPNDAFSSAAVGAAAVEAAQITGWCQHHSDFEQQWQQQQQLWQQQQQQQQQEHHSSGGDGSRRGSTAGDEHMHELSFSVDGGSHLQQQDLAWPGPTQPDLIQTDCIQADITQPDLTQTEIAPPDLAPPDLPQTESAPPESAQPGLAHPDLSQPVIHQLDAALPESVQPDLNIPGSVQPLSALLDLSLPHHRQPDIAQPDFARPDLAQAVTDSSAGGPPAESAHADVNSSSSIPDMIGTSDTSFQQFQSADSTTAAAAVTGLTSTNKPLVRPRASGRESSTVSAVSSTVQDDLQETTSSSDGAAVAVVAAAAAAAVDSLTFLPVSGSRASGRDSYSSSLTLDPGATVTLIPPVQNNQQDSTTSSSHVSLRQSSTNRSSTDGQTATPRAAAAVHDSSTTDAAYSPTSGSGNRSSLMTLSVNGAASTAAEGVAAAAAAADLRSDPEAAAAANLLTSGNAAYTAGNYAAAAADYRAAMEKLGGNLPHCASTSDSNTVSNSGSNSDSNTDDNYGRTMLFAKCSLNLACCHLRLGQYKQCLAECDAILNADPSHVVALCHRGRALLMLQQPEAARSDFLTAEQLLAEEAGQQEGMAAAGAAARPVTPNTLASMKLNNSYWQQRVQQLLENLPPDAK